jgi:GNAT superfamily N-acetyltransferase
MRIVQLAAEDSERLRALRLQALRDDPDAFASTLEEAIRRSLSDWEQQISSVTTFVAVEEGFDVGMVRAAHDSGDRGAAWLISMWVMPGFRRRGIGDHLVKALIRWARSQGLSRILLDVGDRNRAAIALYEQNGFRANGKVGTLPPPRDHITEHQRVLVLSE